MVYHCLAKRHEFQKKIVTLRLYNNNFKISDMKSICAFIASILACVLSASAEIPEKAIPFILDSHVYIQGVVADTIPVSLIYDTGADRLYMDKDYMDLSTFGKLPYKKAKLKWVVQVTMDCRPLPS